MTTSGNHVGVAKGDRTSTGSGDRLHRATHRWLVRHSIAVLRISLGAVFLGFGVLKYLPWVSPAQDLAVTTTRLLTFGLIPGSVALVLVATLECVIGVLLLSGRWLRVALGLLAVELVGILSPMVLLPARLFAGPGHAPTLEGQYVLKDVILAAAVLVIAVTVQGGRLVGAEHEAVAEPATAVGAHRRPRGIPTNATCAVQWARDGAAPGIRTGRTEPGPPPGRMGAAVRGRPDTGSGTRVQLRRHARGRTRPGPTRGESAADRPASHRAAAPGRRGPVLIVDTGPVVALLNEGDVDHARCTALLAGNPDPPLLPVTVLTEVCQLLEVRGSALAEVAFLADVHAGLFTLVDSSAGDLARIIALIDTNAALPLRAVHASVIAAAERLAVTTVATLDRGSFTAVRPRHIPAFTLLP